LKWNYHLPPLPPPPPEPEGAEVLKVMLEDKLSIALAKLSASNAATFPAYQK